MHDGYDDIAGFLTVAEYGSDSENAGGRGEWECGHHKDCGCRDGAAEVVAA